jgi:hypothetical protein
MLNKKLPQISSLTPLSHVTQALKAAEKSLLAMFDSPSQKIGTLIDQICTIIMFF